MSGLRKMSETTSSRQTDQLVDQTYSVCTVVRLDVEYLSQSNKRKSSVMFFWFTLYNACTERTAQKASQSIEQSYWKGQVLFPAGRHM